MDYFNHSIVLLYSQLKYFQHSKNLGRDSIYNYLVYCKLFTKFSKVFSKSNEVNYLELVLCNLITRKLHFSLTFIHFKSIFYSVSFLNHQLQGIKNKEKHQLLPGCKYICTQQMVEIKILQNFNQNFLSLTDNLLCIF